MPYPGALPLVDDFNRPDGEVSSGAGAAIWGGSIIVGAPNGLNIGSETLFASGGNGRTLASFGPDMAIDVTLATLMAQNEGYVFLATRINGASSWSGYGAIFIRVGANSYIHQIRRYDNGSSTVLGGAASTQALALGDQLGFSAVGSLLTLWRKPSGGEWEELATREDGTYTAAGPIGIELTSTTRLDNLHVGPFKEEAKVVLDGEALLSGAGTLTAEGSQAASGSADLSGAGTLSAEGSIALLGEASLTGTGTLQVEGSICMSGEALIQGSGTLEATGTLRASGEALLTGTGDLQVTGAARSSGEALLTGEGVLTVVGEIVGGASYGNRGSAAYGAAPGATYGERGPGGYQE